MLLCRGGGASALGTLGLIHGVEALSCSRPIRESEEFSPKEETKTVAKSFRIRQLPMCSLWQSLVINSHLHAHAVPCLPCVRHGNDHLARAVILGLHLRLARQRTPHAQSWCARSVVFSLDGGSLPMPLPVEHVLATCSFLRGFLSWATRAPGWLELSAVVG